MSSNNEPGTGSNSPGSPPNEEDFTAEEIITARASRGGGDGVPLELVAALRIGGGATRFGGQEGGGVKIGSREGEALIIELRATAIIRGNGSQPTDGSREGEESPEENR